jgi:hypothetical protein
LAGQGVRPRDQEGGIPVAFDLACLTPEQRELWDESFSELDEWTEGTICQATLLELWNFSYICMLDVGAPNWPPELARELSEYGRQLGTYMENMRAASANATRRFTFLLDNDGALLRQDQSLVTDAWWPRSRVWHRFQIDPFTASVTAITPERARELAGVRADIYADVS